MIAWKKSTVVLSALVSCSVSASAQTVPSGEQEFAQRCRALGSVDFSQIVDAPTQVIEAVAIDGNAEAPPHCALRGYVSPNVGFELKLPVTWNGRLFMAGNGGYGGSTHYVERGEKHAYANTLQKGYACIQTDSGHMSTIWDGKWAYNNLQAEIDYGYRATHIAALAGKAIIAHYYGEAPRKSYFVGCSYGGHQALILAQRFPWDFDGIVGEGSPVSLAELFQHGVWQMKSTLDENWKSILDEADIEVLHKNALAKCGGNGSNDGLIADPGSCRIDTRTGLQGRTEDRMPFTCEGRWRPEGLRWSLDEHWCEAPQRWLDARLGAGLDSRVQVARAREPRSGVLSLHGVRSGSGPHVESEQLRFRSRLQASGRHGFHLRRCQP
jgi:feruloyl esterase